MEENDLNNKLASLEAMLFIHGEPISYERIASVLGFNKEEVPALAEELKKRLWERSDSGLALICDEDKAQLMTKPQFHKLLEVFVKDQLSEDLTPASLETLAIISYAGPISRARIEYQRGVNSIVILRNLMLRGLVERFPDPEHPQSFLYRPSFEFWRHIGVAKQSDLPEQEKFKDLLSKFENQTPV